MRGEGRKNMVGRKKCVNFYFHHSTGRSTTRTFKVLSHSFMEWTEWSDFAHAHQTRWDSSEVGKFCFKAHFQDATFRIFRWTISFVQFFTLILGVCLFVSTTTFERVVRFWGNLAKMFNAYWKFSHSNFDPIGPFEVPYGSYFYMPFLNRFYFARIVWNCTHICITNAGIREPFSVILPV